MLEHSPWLGWHEVRLEPAPAARPLRGEGNGRLRQMDTP